MITKTDYNSIEFINAFMSNITKAKWGISKDRTVTVNGDVDIKASKELKELGYLPFKFAIVYGNFKANRCFLKSFKNFPDEVTGLLSVEFNEIKNCNGIPLISKSVSLVGNRGITLNGFKQSTIHGNFFASMCEMHTIDTMIETIYGDADFSDNKLRTFPSTIREVTNHLNLSKNLFTYEPNIKSQSINLSGNPVTADEDGLDRAMW